MTNVLIKGIHMRLPGYGENGPALEIFNYNIMPERKRISSNIPGFAHIAFSVDEVKESALKMKEHNSNLHYPSIVNNQ